MTKSEALKLIEEMITEARAEAVEGKRLDPGSDRSYKHGLSNGLWQAAHFIAIGAGIHAEQRNMLCGREPIWADDSIPDVTHKSLNS